MNGFFKFILLALLVVPLVWITNTVFPVNKDMLCGIKWMGSLCEGKKAGMAPSFKLARTDDKKKVVDPKAHSVKAHDAKAHDTKGHDAKTHDAKTHDAKAHDAKTHDTHPRHLGSTHSKVAPHAPKLQLAVDDVLKDGDALFIHFNQPKATPNKGMIEAVWEAPAFDALTLAHRPEMKDVKTITLYHTLTDANGNVYNFFTYTFDANRLRAMKTGKVTRDGLVATLIEPTGPRMDKDFSQQGLKAQREYCADVNTPAVKASLLCN